MIWFIFCEDDFPFMFMENSSTYSCCMYACFTISGDYFASCVSRLSRVINSLYRGKIRLTTDQFPSVICFTDAFISLEKCFFFETKESTELCIFRGKMT